MLGNCLDHVRKSAPLVHNITNYVTVNDVANILLACGGSPIMSDEPEDVEDITSICGGLPKAFALARDLEFTAELQWRAMAVGTPNILTDGQMAEALERFKTYGQPKKQDAKNTN